MTDAFCITPESCSRDGHSGEIAATVAGRRVFFRFDGLPFPLEPLADPFVVAGMVPAMEKRLPMRVQAGLPTSPSLLLGLRLYQEVYASWYPDLSPVAIETSGVLNAAQGHGVGCFFSGGIDSFHTYLRHAKEITHLILIRGLDIPLNETQRWQRTLAHVSEFAAKEGKQVLVVETNVKQELQSEQHDNHGAILIGTALAARFRWLLVPASSNYGNLDPWGSHPLIDPLLSNGTTQVFYDGAAVRTEKVAAIVRSGIDLSGLRVCNRFSDYNCGKCEKCLRTLVTLQLLGGHSSALPGPADPRQLAAVRIWDEFRADTWTDIANLARATGNSTIAAACERVVRRYRIRHALASCDDRLSGGRLRRLKATVKSRHS